MSKWHKMRKSKNNFIQTTKMQIVCELKNLCNNTYKMS